MDIWQAEHSSPPGGGNSWALDDRKQFTTIELAQAYAEREVSRGIYAPLERKWYPAEFRVSGECKYFRYWAIGPKGETFDTGWRVGAIEVLEALPDER